MFRGIARGRFPMLGRGEVFYHLTYIDDLVRGFGCADRCPQPRAARTCSPDREYTTLNELVALIAARAGRQAAALCTSRCGRCGWRARSARRSACRFGIEPPLFRRRVDFYRKSRAFDTSGRATELGYNPAVDLRTGIRPHGGVVPRAGVV